MDQNEIYAGRQLYDELCQGIFNSKIVIFCISKSYCESENCKRELHFTISHKKKFIPILFCTNKEIEFGTWPVKHSVFFMLADAVYISNVFQHLETPVNSNHQALNDLISLIKQNM